VEAPGFGGGIRKGILTAAVEGKLLVVDCRDGVAKGVVGIEGEKSCLEEGTVEFKLAAGVRGGEDGEVAVKSDGGLVVGGDGRKAAALSALASSGVRPLSVYLP
jgi:hypothetical protein